MQYLHYHLVPHCILFNFFLSLFLQYKHYHPLSHCIFAQISKIVYFVFLCWTAALHLCSFCIFCSVVLPHLFNIQHRRFSIFAFLCCTTLNFLQRCSATLVQHRTPQLCQGQLERRSQTAGSSRGLSDVKYKYKYIYVYIQIKEIQNKYRYKQRQLERKSQTAGSSRGLSAVQRMSNINTNICRYKHIKHIKDYKANKLASLGYASSKLCPLNDSLTSVAKKNVFFRITKYTLYIPL